MTSYFYHLKFELYPYSNDQEITNRGPDQRPNRWIPSCDSDIFSTSAWPSHPRSRIVRRRQSGKRHLGEIKSGARHLQEDFKLGTSGKAEGGGAVIDCGPRRASPSSEDARASQTIATRKSLAFPTPLPQRRLGDLEAARKDWRFDEVRIESFDMAPSREHEERTGHKRGESSASVPQTAKGQNGINAGLSAVGVGRVTKAQYEVVEDKNTELGWGIVHLYRDGEETPALGAPTTSLRGDVRAPEQTSAPATSSGLRMRDEVDGEVEDCTTLCIPAVPSYLTPSDFLGFVGEKTREQVSHFRMVMTGRMNRYLVLMKFRDSGEARRWRAEWDGKVFNSMEPETCHVTFVKSITFQTPNSPRSNTSFPELSHDPFTPSSTSTYLKPFPPPTPNLVELPTCPVCLERMDDTTGLLTILCQHVFHCACLQKWKGSGCPVCRHTNRGPSPSSNSPTTYPQDPLNPPFGSGENQLCSVCDCADDLWICLICGTVGCGRYKGGHAKEHWKDSAHNFALEIETQHVWDYAGDMWVHRLIRDKGNNKIMELPSSSRPASVGGNHHQEDMDLVPREKLERIGMEYTHLLTSQLESQRVYFEELVGKAAAKASAAASSASTANSRADEALAKLRDLELENRKLREDVVTNLEKDLAREKKKAERSGEIARGFGKSLTEEKRVSEGLMGRIEHMNKGLADISGQLTTLKAENTDLQEQNRDLLFSITAGEKLKTMQEAEGGLDEGELEGGTLSLPPEKKGRGKGKGKGK